VDSVQHGFGMALGCLILIVGLISILFILVALAAGNG
jgi:hypothetical protein